MMDYQDRWVVVIGNGLYIAGLGKTFEGYGETVGHVITRRRECALEFTSLREARGVADGIGGRVFKV